MKVIYSAALIAAALGSAKGVVQEFVKECTTANGLRQDTFNVVGMKNKSYNTCYEQYGSFLEYAMYYEDDTNFDMVFKEDAYVPAGSKEAVSVWAFIDSSEGYEFIPECLAVDEGYVNPTEIPADAWLCIDAAGQYVPSPTPIQVYCGACGAAAPPLVTDDVDSDGTLAPTTAPTSAPTFAPTGSPVGGFVVQGF